jgi:nitrogen fixation/metabolism regulation signal transduction histidine kinase
MRRLSHDRRIVLDAALAAGPAVAAALLLLWFGDFAPRTRWTVTAVIVLSWIAFASSLRERLIRPLQTVSNLLSAMREGDFSIRARGVRAGDPLGEVLFEINALTETLQNQRLKALEATALLSRVMAEIDVAVFAFDQGGKLKLTNRAGERLLGQPEERLIGSDAAALGLEACLGEGSPPILDSTFPGGAGRWEIRTSAFRQGGLPHRLLVLADVSRSLREEERQAWRRLIRVLSHELNNSLAPIQSLAESLRALLANAAPPPDWRDDLRSGLAVIASRSEALSRFTNAYAKLARLPPPCFQTVDLSSLVRRVVRLETRLPVRIEAGPLMHLKADPDQLEQVFMNLLRNAVDAALETSGAVEVGWRVAAPPSPRLEVWISDEGPGLSSTTNLFVPFFTTKAGGSGIGLVFSRQIAEAHGGSLTLENRSDRRGCRASLVLPLPPQAATPGAR